MSEKITAKDDLGRNWEGTKDGNKIEWTSDAGHRGTETLDKDGQCESVTGNLTPGQYNADRTGWDNSGGTVPGVITSRK